jgi:AraC-like DNA-binding protein
MAANQTPHQDGRADTLIARQLAAFLQRERIRKVRVAKSTKAPPALAFQVGFPRLSVTLAGVDEMILDLGGGAQSVLTQPRDAVFVPANCWNQPTWSRPATSAHFLFGKKHLGVSLVRHNGKSREPSRHQTVTAHCDMGGAIPALLSTLAGLAEERDAGVMALLVEALIQSSIGLLEATPASLPVRKAKDTYSRICFYLQTNFYQPLTRDSVAAHFQLNPNHLSRLFRQQGLMNFVDYLTWVRMDRAKSLLRHRELTLDEVATRCGFADTAYFCRVFKAKAKQTPTEYRLASAASSAPPA